MKSIRYIICILLLAFPLFAQEGVPDTPYQEQQFFFNGEWRPDEDSTHIGAENYTELKNTRYANRQAGLEGVAGYTTINTTIPTTYTKIRSAFHLKSDRTVKSYTLVQAENTGETGSVIWQNQTSIPSTGDFESTALHADASGAGVGRFSAAPNDHVIYSNGVETKVWGGEEIRTGSFMTMKLGDDDFTLPANYTEAINNTLSSTGNTVTVGASDEKITNGNMELDASWSTVAFEGGETHERSGTQKYSGSYSQTFGVDDADEGIYSVPGFTSVNSTLYYYTLWVYPDDTTDVTIRIRKGDDSGWAVDTTETGLTQDAWNLITGSYTEGAATGGSDATIRILSTGAGTWYVDDVSIYSTGRPFFMVMSTRPLQGVKFYVSSANTSIGVLDAKYWNGSFSNTANQSDGTASSNIPLAATGSFAFDSTVSDAKLYHFEDKYLYAYLFHLSWGSATIYHVSVDAPFQDVLDIPDGVPRQPIKFKVRRSADSIYADYTKEVNEESFEDLPYVAQLDGMTSSDYLSVIFEERMSAIRFDFMANWVNKNSSIAIDDVKYWNGTEYTSVGTVNDNTVSGGTTFAIDNIVWWDPPAVTAEKTKSLWGVEGYVYRIYFDGTLSGSYFGDISVSGAADNGSGAVRITTSSAHGLGTNDVVSIRGIVGTIEANGVWSITVVSSTTFDLVSSDFTNAYTSGGSVKRNGGDAMTEFGDIAIDVVTGVPAQNELKPYKFGSSYRGKTLLCGYDAGKEGERCDFSATYTTEGWNGEGSSFGLEPLYFDSDLVAGHEVYNRYGSRVISMWAGFAKNETYSLQGDTPEEYTIQRVSSNVGCSAPLTLISAEVGYEVSEGIQRNLLFWMTDSGFYSFDGEIIVPLKGVDNYFDSANDECINFDEIDRARGWYDSQKKELNFLIPSGTGQTTNNVWLVYDLIVKRWFRKDTGEASFPQVGFEVSDTYGRKYPYGAIDSGYLVRLENGTSWNGTPIEQVIETGDFWPDKDTWSVTNLQKFKFWATRIAEEHEVIINHGSNTNAALGGDVVFVDTDDTEWTDTDDTQWYNAALATMQLYASDSVNRIARSTVNMNETAWTHRFQWVFSTTDTEKGLQPKGWALVFKKRDWQDGD